MATSVVERVFARMEKNTQRVAEPMQAKVALAEKVVRSQAVGLPQRLVIRMGGTSIRSGMKKPLRI